MAWVMLLGAGLLEVVWAASLKQAQGFTRFVPSIVGIAAAWTSFILLTLALKTLPVGTAYAIWVGIGVVGVAAVGIVWFGEAADPARLVCLALIVAGIAGLKLFGG